MNGRIRLACLLLAAAITLGACGGGGAGGTGGGTGVSPPPPVSPPPVSPPPPPPVVGETSWTPGTFLPASQYLGRCETPRSGVDAAGQAFTDRQGSNLLEKFWLRSWTNETYLWNTEVTDRDPASIESKLDYFDQLRTFARTPSGKEKDDFHFHEPTSAVVARRISAPTATYGARIRILSSNRPRDVRVIFTQDGTPAAEQLDGTARLRRGTRILAVNGIDIVNGELTNAQTDAVNAALFPVSPGITTTMTVRDPGATADRTISITSASISTAPVIRTSVLSTPTGRVGYMVLNTFSPFATERAIIDSMQQLQNQAVGDVVLDLRYNGGGLLAIASQLGYMVAGPTRTVGRAFERRRFNAAAGNFNPVTGAVNTPLLFERTSLGFSVASGAPLPTVNLPRVFILSTATTCSASEAVINGLRGIGVEVVLIGSATCGKPYGFFAADNCGTTYYSIQFQGTNDVGFGDYADGFIPENSTAPFGVRLPGCEVADDLQRELGDPAEAMLAAALQWRQTGQCPARPAGSLSAATERGDETAGPRLREPPEPVMSVNRDLTMPPGR